MEPITEPLRAAVYCRISRDAAGTAAGVERQRESCLKLAADRGWTVDPDHVIIDNDVSASRGPRPGFMRLVALAEQRRVDVFVSWAVDRLTRRLTELESLIELAERTGVKVATVAGDLDLSTGNGRLVGRLLASVARGEVEHKADRQKDANLKRAVKGLPPPVRCFGYQLDGGPHPVEADYARQLFSRFAAGATINGLTTWLNGNGQRPTRTGRRDKTHDAWSRDGVRSMLENRRYIGERWLTGTYIGEGLWEPLIDKDLFEAVQVRLRDPSRRTSPPSSARKWLGAGGLYRCGLCGAAMRTYSQTWRHVDGKHMSQRRYMCTASRHLVRKGEPIDDYVREVILERLRRPDMAALVAEDRDVVEVRKLSDEADALRKRMDTLAIDAAEGRLTGRQVKIVTDRITTKLEAVEAALAVHGQRSSLASIATAPDPGAAWLALEVAQQSSVVEALCTITVQKGQPGRAPFDPDTVEIAWKTSVR